jgi:plasmid stability protein
MPRDESLLIQSDATHGESNLAEANRILQQAVDEFDAERDTLLMALTRSWLLIRRLESESEAHIAHVSTLSTA